uniref:Uncharacterized protein n=1 Tax=Anopheles dirus TaxID=7168 RepID=A0A182NCN6_9DIPT
MVGGTFRDQLRFQRSLLLQYALDLERLVHHGQLLLAVDSSHQFPVRLVTLVVHAGNLFRSDGGGQLQLAQIFQPGPVRTASDEGGMCVEPLGEIELLRFLFVLDEEDPKMCPGGGLGTLSVHLLLDILRRLVFGSETLQFAASYRLFH